VKEITVGPKRLQVIAGGQPSVAFEGCDACCGKILDEEKEKEKEKNLLYDSRIGGTNSDLEKQNEETIAAYERLSYGVKLSTMGDPNPVACSMTTPMQPGGDVCAKFDCVKVSDLYLIVASNMINTLQQWTDTNDTMCSDTKVNAICLKETQFEAVCPFGYVHNFDDPDFEQRRKCIKCQDNSGAKYTSLANAHCMGGYADAYAKNGFWKAAQKEQCVGTENGCIDGQRDTGNDVFLTCQPPDGCQAGNVCEAGYGGERCSECMEGSYRHFISGKCEGCPDGANLLLIVYFSGFVLIGYGGYQVFMHTAFAIRTYVFYYSVISQRSKHGCPCYRHRLLPSHFDVRKFRFALAYICQADIRVLQSSYGEY
jgi:hypothetical protein